MKEMLEEEDYEYDAGQRTPYLEEINTPELWEMQQPSKPSKSQSQTSSHNNLENLNPNGQIAGYDSKRNLTPR